MYTLISIVFIAELIIAYQIISIIVKLDKKVCNINCYIKEFNPLAETFLKYVRLQVSSVTNKISNTINYIRERKNKAIVKILIIVGINVGFILFKINRVKTHKIVNLAVAMFDLAADFSVL